MRINVKERTPCTNTGGGVPVLLWQVRALRPGPALLQEHCGGRLLSNGTWLQFEQKSQQTMRWQAACPNGQAACQAARLQLLGRGLVHGCLLCNFGLAREAVQPFLGTAAQNEIDEESMNNR